ncbi:hypothetical protein GCM10009830_02730 [Glycomyces endophyticus]|uniref:Uncharacterized protein n=1 Tax=Glycomyces endophyticus TaxID=480996 RepID=A0ABN2FWJ2_9ACTN
MEFAVHLAGGLARVEEPEAGLHSEFVAVPQPFDQRFEEIQAALSDLAELGEAVWVDGAIGHGVTLQGGRGFESKAVSILSTLCHNMGTECRGICPVRSAVDWYLNRLIFLFGTTPGDRSPE